jgi:hypothetical protein
VCADSFSFLFCLASLLFSLLSCFTDIFKEEPNRKKFHKRSSSAVWIKDRLTYKEELEYKKVSSFLTFGSIRNRTLKRFHSLHTCPLFVVHSTLASDEGRLRGFAAAIRQRQRCSHAGVAWDYVIIKLIDDRQLALLCAVSNESLKHNLADDL